MPIIGKFKFFYPENNSLPSRGAVYEIESGGCRPANLHELRAFVAANGAPKMGRIVALANHSAWVVKSGDPKAERAPWKTWWVSGDSFLAVPIDPQTKLKEVAVKTDLHNSILEKPRAFPGDIFWTTVQNFEAQSSGV